MNIRPVGATIAGFALLISVVVLTRGADTQAEPRPIEPAPIPMAVDWTPAKQGGYPSNYYVCWDAPNASAAGGWETMVGADFPVSYWDSSHQPTYLGNGDLSECLREVRTGQRPLRKVYVWAGDFPGDPNPETLCDRELEVAKAKGSPLDACKVTY